MLCQELYVDQHRVQKNIDNFAQSTKKMVSTRGLHAKVTDFIGLAISLGTSKTKLAILAFLCG